jgi:hypothetical protein
MQENIKNEVKIPPKHFALLQCEAISGIVLTTDGQRFIGEGQKWLIFSSLQEAEIFGQNRTAENPEIECYIFNALYQLISTVKAPDHIESSPCKPENKEVKKAWWRFW